jgi:PadR family transcriptional regulator PadR
MYSSPMQGGKHLRIGKDLVAASAVPLVLAILDEGESYGYAILKRIHELSGGELEWTDGMLYPLLHRLDRLGYVEAAWASPQGGRRRKYYRITPGGRAALSEQRRQWEVVSGALNKASHTFQVANSAFGTVEP